MLSLFRIALVLAVLLVVGGLILLATVDLQPTPQRIEKTLPSERFQK